MISAIPPNLYASPSGLPRRGLNVVFNNPKEWVQILALFATILRTDVEIGIICHMIGFMNDKEVRQLHNYSCTRCFQLVEHRNFNQLGMSSLPDIEVVGRDNLTLRG